MMVKNQTRKHIWEAFSAFIGTRHPVKRMCHYLPCNTVNLSVSSKLPQKQKHILFLNEIDRVINENAGQENKQNKKKRTISHFVIKGKMQCNPNPSKLKESTGRPYRKLTSRSMCMQSSLCDMLNNLHGYSKLKRFWIWCFEFGKLASYPESSTEIMIDFPPTKLAAGKAV